MKKIGIPCFSIMLLLLCFSNNAKSQFQVKNINSNNLIAGFKEKVSGEIAGFHSSNPDVNNALIVRSTDKSQISWKTAEIPANYKEKYIYFVWLAGLATGNNRQNSSYDFYINEKKALNVKIVKQGSPQNWSLKGENGIELSFLEHSADVNKDCFGFMYLKIPVANYKKGAPLLLTMHAVDTKRYDDFYMTFQYEVKESVSMRPRLLLRKENNQLQQLVAVKVDHILPQQTVATVTDNESVKQQLNIKPGYNEFELWVPAVKAVKQAKLTFNAAGKVSVQNVTLQPVALRELYLVNHSHNDIGYSDLQPVVARKQNDYIRQAMQLIDKTKGYSKEARFTWNIEAMWAVENFMEVATEDEKKKLIAYGKSGDIGLPAGYANLLTGICRPEELIHLTDYSNKLERKYGLNSKTLMISDVPGMSWSVVPALAQRGVRYISSGPNYIPQPGFPDTGGRVGATHRAWGDKPFYWKSASGTDTVLYWQAGTGYSMFQDWNTGRLRFEHKPMNLMLNYLQKLQDEKYPYEMVQMRYSIINDNQMPDEGISDIVEAWNKKYVSPKLVITNVEDMMKTFEQRYAKKIPVVSGDFTPYWEDGAMSTAREEVLVKGSVERLYQSEVLNTLLFPGNYSEDEYYSAWRNAILWHEHTWGAWNSVSRPDEPNVIKQWEYKQNFALQADTLSRKLLQKNINNIGDQNNVYNIINTSSWTRTDLVILAKEQSVAGDVIVDEKGTTYPSQRLSDGRLAFLAKDVPALGNKKFVNKKGKSTYKSNLKIVDDNSIENDAVKLILDKNTGAIKSLVNKETNHQFVDSSKYQGLNQFIYMPGLDPSKVVSVSNVQIKIKENGPLLSTYEVTTKAPGTNSLVQEISLVNELNKVDIVNTVDKEKVRNKESVHFAFPVNVPNGQMRMDIGNGVLMPGKDQLTGANKDYISMQRWVDVSDSKQGVSFITHEVPLIEEGEIVNEMPAASSSSFGGSVSEKKWKEDSNLSNTFFSYAMNNYWYTNYKADQSGPVTFHYSVYLHNGFDASRASRQGTANAQPLLITSSTGQKNTEELPFQLNDENILLTSVKPALSGKGYIVRLYNSSSVNQQLQFNWSKSATVNPPKIYLSNAKEEQLKAFDVEETWAPFSVKTLFIAL